MRFVVLSRTAEELDGRTAYEDGYLHALGKRVVVSIVDEGAEAQVAVGS